VQSVDLTLTLPEWMQLPVPEGLDGAVVREEVLSWQVRPDEGSVAFLALMVGDLDAVREGATEMAPVLAAWFTPVDDDTFYAYVELRLRPADEALWGAFDELDVVLVPPVVYTDSGTMQVTLLGAPEALQDALDVVPDDVAVDVTRVSEHAHRHGTLAGRLTARQFEALRAARDCGYYDVPRDCDLAAVAADLECSPSAASTLLREAEARLVDAALGR
jgi:hypothetical protein